MAMMVFTAVSVVAILTLMLASLLLFASRKLYVEEDPRLDQVEDMLPHNNCGGCGFPSCRMFAEALISEKALPAKCTVSSDEEKAAVASFLNVEQGVQIKRVARLACAGGSNVSKKKAEYEGLLTCAAASQVAGGGRSCMWGCLGLGDCEKSCDFDAIRMNVHSLPIVDESKCTACGDCVVACPKDLFTLQSIETPLWVACKNLLEGDQVLNDCQVACTACGRCAVDAPNGLISMVNNLPSIDYNHLSAHLPNSDSRVAIERCPTGAILWFDKNGQVLKGAAAKKTVRQSALPISES